MLWRDTMRDINLVTIKNGIEHKKGYTIDYVEAYRNLRTNLEFTSFNKALQVIVITSSSREEGKSTTSSNLAVTMANYEERVLLIDADLRIPNLNNIFRINNNTGLSTAMLHFKSKDFNLLDYCYQIKHSKIQNRLFVMPTGPIVPNPTAILSSARFFEFVTYLRDYFDKIIIDSPPVLPVAETIPIGLQSDGVLFCVAAQKTKRDHAKTAVEKLQRSNINVIGSVVTMIKDHENSYYHSYYSNDYQPPKKGIFKFFSK